MGENSQIIKGSYKLILSIVKKGLATKVVAATKKNGAEGGTMILARGSSHSLSYFGILGLDNEMEKEIVLTIAPEEKVDGLLEIVSETARLDKPGNGIAFVLNIKCIEGICHLLKMQHS